MWAVLVSAFKGMGAWVLSELLSFLGGFVVTWYERKKRLDEAEKINQENAQKLKDALAKGNDDEIANASESTLNGDKP